MHRLAALSGALLVAACLSPAGGTLRFDFEEGLDGWQKDSDLPLDPNDPDPEAEVAWEIDTQERDRGQSARFFLDGRQDDGTIWIERRVDPGGQQRAEVRIDAWSASESFNTLAYLVSYLGPDDPQNEEDFPAPGQNSGRDDIGHGGLRETLNQAEGWHTYTYNWTVPDEGPLWFAVGVSVVWETEITYYVDDVEIAFTS